MNVHGRTGKVGMERFPIFLYDTEDLTIQYWTHAGPDGGKGIICTAATAFHARMICQALDKAEGIGTALS